jgi:Fic family protein
MIFATPSLRDDELAVLDRVAEVRKSAGYAFASTKRWTGSLRRMAFAKAVRGSNTIEGYHVTVEDAIAAVEEEEPMDAASETWAAVTGYRDAMSYVLQLENDPDFSFSRGLIRSLHFMMLKHDISKNPGKWRPGPVFVQSEETGEFVYEGPQADQVDSLMLELMRELNQPHQTGVPVMVRAAMAHLNLVMIHPFSDGNGRMGRCLQTLVLARESIISPVLCSIEEYLGYKQKEYYEVLAQVGDGSWNPDRDARPWVRFCITAHFRQASNLARWIRIYQRLWELLSPEAERAGLPDRVLPTLSEAALGWKSRNAVYRKSADVSDLVASRDLKAMVGAGLLVPKGEKRGRHYVASERLFQIGRKAVEPYVEIDPFDVQAKPKPPTAKQADLFG